MTKRRNPWALDPDAPDVPTGLRPKDGVDYGCGMASCRTCYKPWEEDDSHGPRCAMRFSGPCDCGKADALMAQAG